MKRVFLTAFLTAVMMVSFFFAAPLFAQQATTSLNGVVTDSSGAMLPGASVSITREATGQTLKTTANSRGEYTFQQLSPGTWTVTVNANGFSDQSKVGEILVSKPATINFKLTVQASATTVDVSSEAETLNTTDAKNNSTLRSSLPARCAESCRR